MVEIGCTPYNMHQPREPEVIFKEKNDEKVEGTFKELISMAWQVYIKPKDLERFGFRARVERTD